MTSVQENKNELEAAVRYCESAISRAKATIESMEFRQQAASKAWHEQTGREAALAKENLELEERNDELNAQVVDLKVQYDEAKTNMALMTDELEKLRSEKEASSAPCGCQAYRDIEEEHAMLEKNVKYFRDDIATLKDQLAEREDKWDQAMLENARLNDQIAELSKAYNEEVHETNVWKKAHQEQRELVGLRDDQIAMLERRLAKKSKSE